jgi:hypothetical protein
MAEKKKEKKAISFSSIGNLNPKMISKFLENGWAGRAL